MSHGLTHQVLEHHGLERSWAAQVGDQFDEPYMRELGAFLRAEEQDGAEIYPPEALWFEALNRTAFQDVKVVILGQDPYHGQGQAHGLSFSVPPHVAIPPSLRNIYKELSSDVGIPPPTQGSLTNWAERGVLLLNATLTVTAGEAGSHQKKRVGNLYGCDYQQIEYESATSRLSTLGQLRAEKRRAYRSRSPSGAVCTTPFTFIGTSRFFGLSAFLESK